LSLYSDSVVSWLVRSRRLCERTTSATDSLNDCCERFYINHRRLQRCSTFSVTTHFRMVLLTNELANHNSWWYEVGAHSESFDVLWSEPPCAVDVVSVRIQRLLFTLNRWSTITRVIVITLSRLIIRILVQTKIKTLIINNNSTHEKELEKMVKV